jgi:hypothetical protein
VAPGAQRAPEPSGVAAPAPIAPAATPATPDACLGPSLPITIAAGLPYVTVKVGSAPAVGSGAFLLDFATTRSTIDLAAFGANRPAAGGCEPRYLGERCAFLGFDLFGDLGDVLLVTADHAGVGAGGLRQAGMIGTDLLARAVYTLDYEAKVVRRALADDACSDAELGGLGFTALSSAGSYARDPAGLAQLSTVVADAAPGVRVPNVPTVPLRIGAVRAPVQLDTGFDDALHPLSVNVNEAFLAAVLAENPSALVRARERDLSLSTCAGIAEPVEAYVLAPGTTLALVDEVSADAMTTGDATLFVKRTPVAARRCGGIGTWTAPAAQLGAAFFARLRTVVFDPYTSRVWVKRGP